MLNMVIENPIQFTIVSAEPRLWVGACFATKLENKGESAMTMVLQKNRNPRKRMGFECCKNRGETKQQIPEQARAILAINLAPYVKDN
jgi:hypothetical protein